MRRPATGWRSAGCSRKSDAGAPITFDMFGRAIAEFEFTLVFADAPIDRFARGEHGAMTAAEKRGALVFFGNGKCVTCHAVKGQSNEMFSDFQNHVIGVPQIAPFFGVGRSNMIFDGPDANEDFGRSRSPAIRPIGICSGRRRCAISRCSRRSSTTDRSRRSRARFGITSTPYGRPDSYNPKKAGIDRDLTRRQMGPIEPVLERLDPELVGGIHLTESQIDDLTQFVTTGLLDRRALKENLCKLVPRVAEPASHGYVRGLQHQPRPRLKELSALGPEPLCLY